MRIPRSPVWTLLFDDFLLECDVLRRHAELGRLGFGINHVVVGPINKTLDLVLTRVPPSRGVVKRQTFATLVERYGIVLDPDDRSVLGALPIIEQDTREDVSEVLVALGGQGVHDGTREVRLPRLHAEILATGYLAKRAVRSCIVVSYSLVNAAPTFRTPSGKGRTNKHKQPDDARKVVGMLANAVPLARDYGNLLGFDVVGATVIDCRNDGSPVSVCEGAEAPARASHVHYEANAKAAPLLGIPIALRFLVAVQVASPCPASNSNWQGVDDGTTPPRLLA